MVGTQQLDKKKKNKQIADSGNTGQKRKQLDHEWINRRVQIWFQDKKRYFVGTIVSESEIAGEFEIKWKNGKTAQVSLNINNCNNNEKDEDRWNFL